MLKIIWAKIAVVGLHHWPAPSEHRKYLGAPHRHLFGVRASVVVRSDEREVEFHDLQDLLEEAMDTASSPLLDPSGLRDFGPQSCESIAKKVLAYLDARVPGAVRDVTVDEDGECGATIYPMR